MTAPTPEPADFDVALVEGFAMLLAAGPAPVGTWRTAGDYQAAETGIVVGVLPQSPDRVIALTAYGVDDDPSLSDSVIGLQVITRWGGQDPRPVGRLTSRVFDALHGLHDVVLPTGVRVVQCLRRSWVSMGQDQSSRWRTSQNFYATVHRPSTHRT